MTTISRLAAVALLSMSIASVALPNLAAAASTLPPPPVPCGPFNGCGGGGSPDTPDTPPSGSDDPFDWETFGKNDPDGHDHDDGTDDEDDESADDAGSTTSKGKKPKTGGTAAIRGPAHALQLDCAIRDQDPTTSDFWLVNVGTDALPVGTRVQYRIPATGDRGAFMLRQEIPAGKARVLPNFISAAVKVGSECAVQIIS